MKKAFENKWMQLLSKMPSLFFGLFLYSVGILCTIYSKLGVSPWDVFHLGVAGHTGIKLGIVMELTGLVVLFLSYLLGIIPGFGSICNMIFIGTFIDILNKVRVFRTPESVLGKVLLLFAGIFAIGWATYFYLRVQLGAGPRDSLMEGLVKKLDKPVWAIRGAIEISILLIGVVLGGPFGVGTIVTAFTIGFSVQLAFKIGKYDSKKNEHMNIIELYKYLLSKEKDNKDTRYVSE